MILLHTCNTYRPPTRIRPHRGNPTRNDILQTPLPQGGYVDDVSSTGRLCPGELGGPRGLREVVGGGDEGDPKSRLRTEGT